MANINVKCKSCGAEFSVPDSLAGEKATCKCGKPILIPRPGEAPASRTIPPVAKLKADKWYVHEKGQSIGPLSFDDLKERMLHGQLKSDQKVYAACLKEWVLASEIEALRVGKATGDKWYVSVKEKRYGPYDDDYMEQMIKSGRLVRDSKVWTTSLGDWRPLSRIGRFEGALRAAEAGETVEEMWYFMRDEERVGPLSLEQLVKAARAGRIRAEDRVWSNRLGNWMDPMAVPELVDAMKTAKTTPAGDLWYYRAGENVGGPINFDELVRLVETKKVRAGDTVFSKSVGAWKDIRDVPELEPAIVAAETGFGTADSDAEKWYFRAQGKERGPVSERFLAELVAKGTLKASDQVWSQSNEKWQPVSAVSQLARYLSGAELRTLGDETVVEPTEVPTSMVEAAAARRMAKWKVIGIGAVGVLIVALAVVLFLESGGNEEGENGGGGGGTRVPGFELPTEPNKFLRTWLELFVADTSKFSAADQETHRQKLQMFYLGEHLDVYAEDLWQALVRAKASPQGWGLKFDPLDCTLRRAADGETFCYYFKELRVPSVTVKVRVPPEPGKTETEVEKSFTSLDFRPLRMYRITWEEGNPFHPGARVLIAELKEGLRICAFGRVGLVGSQAGAMRIDYVTGYKATSTRESDCQLLLGISNLPGTDKDQWEDYGEMLSVDSWLVPQKVLRRRDEETAGLITSGQLVVMAQSGVVSGRLRDRYGEPSSSKELDLSSIYLDVVHADDAGGKIYSRTNALYYGKLGLAVDPASAEVVAFLFPTHVSQ